MARNDCDGTVQFRLPPRHVRISHDVQQMKEQFGVGTERRARRRGMKSPLSAEFNSPLMTFEQRSRCSQQKPQRTRDQFNWASGGPGMQAIFLGSGPSSCGTGVFLPRREGAAGFSNKPTISPVLLPARVVQALNLNVHELGQQIIKPQPDHQFKNNVKKIDEKLEKKQADDVCLSPDIFLPKEWTY